MSKKALAQRALAALLACAALVALDASRHPTPLGAAMANMPPASGPDLRLRLRPEARGTIPMPEGAAAAHASFLLPMPRDSAAALSAFWFAGDRESAPNVQIAAAQWDRASQRWSAARYVVNREVAGAALGFGLRRLGNPVAWRDGVGRIHLFVVATGWGGWAAGRILHLRQRLPDNTLAGLEFEPQEVLPLGWLWNTSFLVRNAPLELADGGMLLPVYFELGLKYPVALRFDRLGQMRGMQRISDKSYALQPTLLAQSPTHWLALMRDHRPEGRLIAARTEDGGAHWSDLPDLDLPNPDAAVAGLALGPLDLLLVHNNASNSRERLDLSGSSDGQHWRPLLALETGASGAEYSYPSMAWVDGALWVSYTDQRRDIAWQRLRPQTAGATP